MSRDKHTQLKRFLVPKAEGLACTTDQAIVTLGNADGITWRVKRVIAQAILEGMAAKT